MSAAPRTARGTRTRAKLLQAAETVFASVGYHEASIVKITEEAGVGLGTFYLYFEGKQAIFDEAKKTGFGQQITDSVTILVSSRGKADPVAPNTTSLGRRRNRRVRFAFST